MAAPVLFAALDAVFEGMDAYSRFTERLAAKQQELVSKGLEMTWADVNSLMEEGNRIHDSLKLKLDAAMKK